MKNIFLTIQESLIALPGWSLEDRLDMWYFVLSLPMPDVTRFGYLLESKNEDLLDAFRDTHPMWLSTPYTDKDLTLDAAFDFSTEGQMRMARTLYHLISGVEEDMADAIRQSMELATDGSFRFSDRPDAEREYLERICTVAFWFYVSHLTSNREAYLWNNYYLVNGLRLGFDLGEALANYLNEFYEQPRIRRETVAAIVALLEKNPTVLPAADGAKARSVGEWLVLAGKEAPARPTKEDIDGFLAKHPEFLTLTDSDRAWLPALLLVYGEMKTGLWDKHPAMKETFLDRLFAYLEKESGEGSASISSLENECKAWYATQKDGFQARQKIILALADRVEIEDHAESLTVVNEWLGKLDAAHPDLDLFYFDEKKGDFSWNEAVFTLDPNPQFIEPPASEV